MPTKAQWETVLEEIREACARIGITLRETTRIRSGGALCTVRGRKVVILNRTLDPEDKVALLAKELRGEDFSGVFLKPQVREILERGG